MIFQATPLPAITPPLRYRAPSWNVIPPTKIGASGIAMPVPCLSTQTPPFGSPWLLPESPAKIAPSPNANEVGFLRPVANSDTLAPPNVLGGGGPAAAVAAVASSPDTTAVAPTSRQKHL